MDDIPASKTEQALMMEGILVAAATGGSGDARVYQVLRKTFISDPNLRELLPQFVRTYRNLDAFWPFIKNKAPTYAERREFISSSFTPLVDYLEGRSTAPVDAIASEVLQTFDLDGVQSVWEKALTRRKGDPEGAITMARTLLETVVKCILEELGEDYDDREDLPKIYARVAQKLSLAPSQHAEEPIKAVLGGAMNLVNGIGTLRNKLSDSHGRGRRVPARPSARHASLAVNTAGAIAVFLVETFQERQ